MKESTNLLDSLDYLVSHEVTNEKCIKIEKLALEGMETVREHMLIDKWAQKGKKRNGLDERS